MTDELQVSWGDPLEKYNAHLAGPHIDEEAGGERVQHHLRPGVDVGERCADAHANGRRCCEWEQENARLPAPYPPQQLEPLLQAYR